MPLESTPPQLPPLDPSTPPEGGGPLGSDPREWVLIRYVGQPLGQYLPIPAGGMDLGRGPENALCLPEPEVSRRHARLTIAPDQASVELWDLGSTNGVFVNGRRVKANPEPYRLSAEDVLRVGSHAFKLKHLDALERDYHRDMATRSSLDGLTGVGNRSTVLNQLEVHMELARRHGRALSVILLDLDRFKGVNDTRGHAVGDRVLEWVGRLLVGRLRGSDPVGRLGGDEFLAVLPETPAALALKAAEDLREAMEAHRLDPGDGQLVRVTGSLGLAELKEGDLDGGALLARADAALYSAKAGGRNRVVAAP